eukprot:PhF_6_TR27173/c0_g1_i1/m.39821
MLNTCGIFIFFCVGILCSPTTAQSPLWDDIFNATTNTTFNVTSVFLRNSKGVTIPWQRLPTTLVTMIFYDNAVSGTVAWELLPRTLVKLTLSSNHFTGTVAWSMLPPNLEDMQLTYNLISGTVAWESLPQNMYNLDLGYNDFSGTIPTLTKLPRSLKALSIFRNRFHGGFPWAEVPPSLQWLDVGNNDFTGSVALEPTWDLFFLRVAANRFTGTFPWLRLPKYLTNLMNGFNTFVGTIPWESIRQPLKSLSIPTNQFTGALQPDKLPNISRTVLYMNTERSTFNGAASLFDEKSYAEFQWERELSCITTVCEDGVESIVIQSVEELFPLSPGLPLKLKARPTRWFPGGNESSCTLTYILVNNMYAVVTKENGVDPLQSLTWNVCTNGSNSPPPDIIFTVAVRYNLTTRIFPGIPLAFRPAENNNVPVSGLEMNSVIFKATRTYLMIDIFPYAREVRCTWFGWPRTILPQSGRYKGFGLLALNHTELFIQCKMYSRMFDGRVLQEAPEFSEWGGRPRVEVRVNVVKRKPPLETPASPTTFYFTYCNTTVDNVLIWGNETRDNNYSVCVKPKQGLLEEGDIVQIDFPDVRRIAHFPLNITSPPIMLVNPCFVGIRSIITNGTTVEPTKQINSSSGLWVIIGNFSCDPYDRTALQVACQVDNATALGRIDPDGGILCSLPQTSSTTQFFNFTVRVELVPLNSNVEVHPIQKTILLWFGATLPGRPTRKSASSSLGLGASSENSQGILIASLVSSVVSGGESLGSTSLLLRIASGDMCNSTYFEPTFFLHPTHACIGSTNDCNQPPPESYFALHLGSVILNTVFGITLPLLAVILAKLQPSKIKMIPMGRFLVWIGYWGDNAAVSAAYVLHNIERHYAPSTSWWVYLTCILCICIAQCHVLWMVWFLYRNTNPIYIRTEQETYHMGTFLDKLQYESTTSLWLRLLTLFSGTCLKGIVLIVVAFLTMQQMSTSTSCHNTAGAISAVYGVAATLVACCRPFRVKLTTVVTSLSYALSCAIAILTIFINDTGVVDVALLALVIARTIMVHGYSLYQRLEYFKELWTTKGQQAPTKQIPDVDMDSLSVAMVEKDTGQRNTNDEML